MASQYKIHHLKVKREVELLDVYYQLLRIRRVEEAISKKYSEWEIRCPVHLSIGQEAIPVGISMYLSKKDHVYSNHRSHGHYFAKGGDLKRMIAELYGKETGCCGGRGGSMHLIDLSVGFMGSTPIVGGTVPLAVGDAWSSVLKKENRISVVYFGDGCFEEGVLHESMNFAALHKLPVIFVCENNGYSVYTKLIDRQPNRKIIDIAKAHGMQTYSADGNDVFDIMQVACNAIGNVKNGNGPQFLEFETYRWLEHCGPNDDDHLNYRPQGELLNWKDKCPIEKLKNHILEKSLNCTVQLQLIEDKITAEILEAFEFAENSNSPDIEQLDKYIYV
jgi:TPP-dependent pyruvate/acetoin dehydrogenase alpha subunit